MMRKILLVLCLNFIFGCNHYAIAKDSGAEIPNQFSHSYEILSVSATFFYTTIDYTKEISVYVSFNPAHRQLIRKINRILQVLQFQLGEKWYPVYSSCKCRDSEFYEILILQQKDFLVVYVYSNKEWQYKSFIETDDEDMMILEILTKMFGKRA